jgi:predicted PurR-regulated permease PerM
MKPSLNFMAYLIYLPIMLLLTWYVAHTLFKNSKVFMMDIFNGRSEIAISTNKLFETGFYLLNLGFGLSIMQIAYELGSGQSLMEALSTKLGGFSIYLGLSLFFNLYLFFRGKRVAKRKAQLASSFQNAGIKP